MLPAALRPAFVLPKAEICVRNHVQPYISSILEALMTPTSQGFAEVREVFFKEVTDMNMNIVNEGGLEKLVEVSSEPGRVKVGGGMANPIAVLSRDGAGEPQVGKIPGDGALVEVWAVGWHVPALLSSALSPVHGEAVPPGLPPSEDAVVLREDGAAEAGGPPAALRRLQHVCLQAEGSDPHATGRIGTPCLHPHVSPRRSCWSVGTDPAQPFGPPLPLTSWLLSQQMDDALYTFETLLHQELGKLQGKDELCKSIQRILERVLKVRAGAAPMPWGFLG